MGESGRDRGDVCGRRRLLRSCAIDIDGGRAMPAKVAMMDSADQRLISLAFLQGDWASRDAEGISEEIWSEPCGKTMMGTFRMVKPDGTLAVQEALAIVAEENGVFMRVRHFDAAMTAREEKDAPIVLQLEQIVDRTAVFRKVSGSKSLDTITYRRTSEDVLASEVAFTPESKRETLRFEMTRVR